MDAGDLSSSSHGCAASTLSTEPVLSPAPIFPVIVSGLCADVILAVRYDFSHPGALILFHFFPGGLEQHFLNFGG